MALDSAGRLARSTAASTIRATTRRSCARAPAERSRSACPPRNCAATVGPIVGALAALRERGPIDEIVVIDGGSSDATVRIAADAGATVHPEAELMAGLRPGARARATRCGARSACSTASSSASSTPTSLEFSAALRDRPARPADRVRRGRVRQGVLPPPVPRTARLVVADGGGRVNHLLARPALAIFYPALAGVRQPLAGEIAARRSLLERLPFATGYGVEIAMLLDVLRRRRPRRDGAGRSRRPPQQPPAAARR